MFGSGKTTGYVASLLSSERVLALCRVRGSLSPDRPLVSVAAQPELDELGLPIGTIPDDLSEADQPARQRSFSMPISSDAHLMRMPTLYNLKVSSPALTPQKLVAHRCTPLHTAAHRRTPPLPRAARALAYTLDPPTCRVQKSSWKINGWKAIEASHVAEANQSTSHTSRPPPPDAPEANAETRSAQLAVTRDPRRVCRSCAQHLAWWCVRAQSFCLSFTRCSERCASGARSKRSRIGNRAHGWRTSSSVWSRSCQRLRYLPAVRHLPPLTQAMQQLRWVLLTLKSSLLGPRYNSSAPLPKLGRAIAQVRLALPNWIYRRPRRRRESGGGGGKCCHHQQRLENGWWRKRMVT